ncbi:MAG: type II toxin-antitoxin system CcdA family antitoxin [Acetobacteraceae bacterium]
MRPALSARRATNVTLPAPLLAEARALQVNLSQAAERGLREAVAEARRQRWQAENEAAIAEWNAHVEAHQLPLAAFRGF